MACGRELELGEVPGGAFDDSPLHVLGLASVRALAAEMGWAVDHRRFRANIYLDGPGLVPDSEPTWAGGRFEVGSAILSVTEGCPRCAITTRDPATFQVEPALLRQMAQTRRGLMGVYCAVISPGRATAGDPLVWR